MKVNSAVVKTIRLDANSIPRPSTTNSTLIHVKLEVPWVNVDSLATQPT